jgi:hypothetical protein
VTKSHRKQLGKSSRRDIGPQPKHPKKPSAAATAGNWKDRLFDPIDVSSIALFRICFGVLLLRDVHRMHSTDGIKLFYIDPPTYFPFFGFDFIRPLPGDGMYLLFGALAISAVLITVGLFYRVAMVVFTVGFAYVFLIDQTRYLNHFYFAGLLAFLMIFVPAARGWSLDALISGREDTRVPAWSLWILRVQMEIMLIYAGIVKLNSDWLQGEPLRVWLGGSSDLPIIGPLLLNDTITLIGSWSAAFLHLIGAMMLLFKSTRMYAFVIYCLFHISNAVFFNIDIFPWLTIAATTLFFDPDWPKVFWRRLTEILRLPASLQIAPPSSAVGAWRIPGPVMRTAVVSFILVWTVIQVLVPLRHFRYPGLTGWHDQGYYFAWQMMLRQRDGAGVFYVRDPDTSREWLVEPRNFITAAQAKRMLERPEMLRHFAYYLEKVWAERYGTRDVEVRAFVVLSLNGRRAEPFIDPTRDLTKIDYTFGPSDWILPQKETALPPKEKRYRNDRREALLRLLKTDPAVARILANRDENQNVSSQPNEKSQKLSSHPSESAKR